MDKDELFEYLTDSEVLVTPRLQEAFYAVDRADFVLPEFQHLTYEDHPLPIGLGQSISQPSTVAFMLELLNPQPEEVILDLGTGSGWTTGILSKVVGQRGRIYSVEILPDLLEFAKDNLSRYSAQNITLRQASQRLGLPEFAPFHKIMVSAAAQDIPATLVEQLTLGGTLVMPVQNSIVQLHKISDVLIETRTFPGFAFVPLQYHSRA